MSKYRKILKEYINNKFENREQKTFNQTQNFSISIQAAPGQDTRSLADEVIKRIREQARGALFDAVEELY